MDLANLTSMEELFRKRVKSVKTLDISGGNTYHNESPTALPEDSPVLRLTAKFSYHPVEIDRATMVAASPYIQRLLRTVPETEGPISLDMPDKILRKVVHAVKQKASAGPLASFHVRLDRGRSHLNIQKDAHLLDALFPIVEVYVTFADLPALFLASYNLEMQELTGALRNFFFLNIDLCIADESFLWSAYEDEVISFFVKVAESAVEDRIRKLETAFDQWMEWCHRWVNYPRANYVVRVCRSTSTEQPSLTKPSEPAVLLVDSHACYRLVDNSFEATEMRIGMDGLLGLEPSIDWSLAPILVQGPLLYTAVGRDLVVFHAPHGVPLRQHSDVFTGRLSGPTCFSRWRNRIYCAHDRTIFEILIGGLWPVFSTPTEINSFAVLNHSAERFEFCYSSDAFVGRIACDRYSRVLESKSVLFRGRVIGNDPNGYVFVWDYDKKELVCKKDHLRLIRYAFDEQPLDAEVCGPEVYLRFGHYVAVVNTANGQQRYCEDVPAGRLLTCWL